MIEVYCTCGKGYRVAKQHAGRTLRCKVCGAAILVPGDPAAEPDLSGIPNEAPAAHPLPWAPVAAAEPPQAKQPGAASFFTSPKGVAVLISVAIACVILIGITYAILHSGKNNSVAPSAESADGASSAAGTNNPDKARSEANLQKVSLEVTATGQPAGFDANARTAQALDEFFRQKNTVISPGNPAVIHINFVVTENQPKEFVSARGAVNTYNVPIIETELKITAPDGRVVWQRKHITWFQTVYDDNTGDYQTQLNTHMWSLAATQVADFEFPPASYMISPPARLPSNALSDNPLARPNPYRPAPDRTAVTPATMRTPGPLTTRPIIRGTARPANP